MKLHPAVVSSLNPVRPESRSGAAVYRGASQDSIPVSRYADCAGYSTRTGLLSFLSGLSLLFASIAAAASEAPTLKGDAARGQLVFGQCRTCHYPEMGYGHHNGPSLWNLFKRKAGTAEGYAHYSDEMKRAGFVWTPELLDFWLANPRRFLPNSTMVVFETTPQQRADLIEYLKQFQE